MNDQLKAFLDSLMYVLMLIRTEGVKGYDWAIDARAQVFLACTLGIITPAQRERLLALCGEARFHSRKPFPSERNAGPCITWFELHKREQAAAIEAQPPVQAAEPFFDEPEYMEPCPTCEGNGEVDGWPCVRCSGSARVPADVKPQAQDSANEKPEPVPAPTPRRELRLLCVLVKSKLDPAQGTYLPIHTMHRLPPRAMVKGQWSEPRFAGLHLRETQSRQPSTEVLERCLPKRHLRTNGRLSVLGGTV